MLKLYDDTEGYDHILIENLINETKVRPVIVFEWVNIPNDGLKDFSSSKTAMSFKISKRYNLLWS